MAKLNLALDVDTEETGAVFDLNDAADNDETIEIRVNGNTYYAKVDGVR